MGCGSSVVVTTSALKNSSNPNPCTQDEKSPQSNAAERQQQQHYDETSLLLSFSLPTKKGNSLPTIRGSGRSAVKALKTPIHQGEESKEGEESLPTDNRVKTDNSIGIRNTADRPQSGRHHNPATQPSHHFVLLQQVPERVGAAPEEDFLPAARSVSAGGSSTARWPAGVTATTQEGRRDGAGFDEFEEDLILREEEERAAREEAQAKREAGEQEDMPPLHNDHNNNNNNTSVRGEGGGGPPLNLSLVRAFSGVSTTASVAPSASSLHHVSSPRRGLPERFLVNEKTNEVSECSSNIPFDSCPSSVSVAWASSGGHPPQHTVQSVERLPPFVGMASHPEHVNNYIRNHYQQHINGGTENENAPRDPSLAPLPSFYTGRLQARFQQSHDDRVPPTAIRTSSTCANSNKHDQRQRDESHVTASILRPELPMLEKQRVPEKSARKDNTFSHEVPDDVSLPPPPPHQGSTSLAGSLSFTSAAARYRHINLGVITTASKLHATASTATATPKNDNIRTSKGSNAVKENNNNNNDDNTDGIRRDTSNHTHWDRHNAGVRRIDDNSPAGEGTHRLVRQIRREIAQHVTVGSRGVTGVSGGDDGRPLLVIKDEGSGHRFSSFPCSSNLYSDSYPCTALDESTPKAFLVSKTFSKKYINAVSNSTNQTDSHSYSQEDGLLYRCEQLKGTVNARCEDFDEKARQRRRPVCYQEANASGNSFLSPEAGKEATGFASEENPQSGCCGSVVGSTATWYPDTRGNRSDVTEMTFSFSPLRLVKNGEGDRAIDSNSAPGPEGGGARNRDFLHFQYVNPMQSTTATHRSSSFASASVPSAAFSISQSPIPAAPPTTARQRHPHCRNKIDTSVERNQTEDGDNKNVDDDHCDEDTSGDDSGIAFVSPSPLLKEMSSVPSLTFFQYGRISEDQIQSHSQGRSLNTTKKNYVTSAAAVVKNVDALDSPPSSSLCVGSRRSESKRIGKGERSQPDAFGDHTTSSQSARTASPTTAPHVNSDKDLPMMKRRRSGGGKKELSSGVSTGGGDGDGVVLSKILVKGQPINKVDDSAAGDGGGIGVSVVGGSARRGSILVSSSSTAEMSGICVGLYTYMSAASPLTKPIRRKDNNNHNNHQQQQKQGEEQGEEYEGKAQVGGKVVPPHSDHQSQSHWAGRHHYQQFPATTSSTSTVVSASASSPRVVHGPTYQAVYDRKTNPNTTSRVIAKFSVLDSCSSTSSSNRGAIDGFGTSNESAEHHNHNKNSCSNTNNANGHVTFLVEGGESGEDEEILNSSSSVRGRTRAPLPGGFERILATTFVPKLEESAESGCEGSAKCRLLLEGEGEREGAANNNHTNSNLVTSISVSGERDPKTYSSGGGRQEMEKGQQRTTINSPIIIDENKNTSASLLRKGGGGGGGGGGHVLLEEASSALSSREGTLLATPSQHRRENLESSGGTGAGAGVSVGRTLPSFSFASAAAMNERNQKPHFQPFSDDGGKVIPVFSINSVNNAGTKSPRQQEQNTNNNNDGHEVFGGEAAWQEDINNANVKFPTAISSKPSFSVSATSAASLAYHGKKEAHVVQVAEAAVEGGEAGHKRDEYSRRGGRSDVIRSGSKRRSLYTNLYDTYEYMSSPHSIDTADNSSYAYMLSSERVSRPCSKGTNRSGVFIGGEPSVAAAGAVDALNVSTTAFAGGFALLDDRSGGELLSLARSEVSPAGPLPIFSGPSLNNNDGKFEDQGGGPLAVLPSYKTESRGDSAANRSRSDAAVHLHNDKGDRNTNLNQESLRKHAKDGEDTNTKKIALNPEVFQPFKLVSKTSVSHDTRILRFALQSPQHTLGLPIGQHMYLKATVDGAEVQRAYTPISSDDDLGYFELLIKIPSSKGGGEGNNAYYAGMASHLDGLPNGSMVEGKGPFGKFSYEGNGVFRVTNQTADPVYRKVKAFGMIAGGSGITPMYQIIKAILKNPADPTLIYLLFANSTREDVVLLKELEDMAASDAETRRHRLRLWFTLTRGIDQRSPTTSALEETALDEDKENTKNVEGPTRAAIGSAIPPRGRQANEWQYGVGPVTEKMLRDHFIPPFLEEKDGCARAYAEDEEEEKQEETCEKNTNTEQTHKTKLYTFMNQNNDEKGTVREEDVIILTCGPAPLIKDICHPALINIGFAKDGSQFFAF